MKIDFTNLKIDKIERSSGAFTGENHQAHWRNFKNTKEGFGSLTGAENQYSKGKHGVVRTQSQFKDDQKEKVKEES